MPYVVTADATGCDGWAVVKSDTREVVGCHATDAEAERQQLALYARERIGKGMSRRTVSVGTMQLREMERGPDGWWRPRKRDEEEPGAVERVVEVIFDAGGGEELPVDVVDAGDAEEAPGDVVDGQAATMRLRARSAAARARIAGAGRRVFVLADRQDRALVATLALQARAAAQHRAVERVSRREA